MKKYHFFNILLCFVFTTSISSCERTELQKASTNSSELITPREITACDQCPNETDCCCGIELQDVVNGSANLRLCGTTDGVGSCLAPSPPNPCISISGGGQSTGTLYSGDPKHGFCMAPGTSFYVQNLSSAAADIYITCQDDVTFPQKLTITIPGNTTYYFNTNSGCEVARCQ